MLKNRYMRNKLLLLLFLGQTMFCFSNKKQTTDDYNVVWNSASNNFWGSMPVGNGDIGSNVWVSPDGLLLFYISKTDAFSENGRLLKIGKASVKFTPEYFFG
jgi:alpha-L-fucosidase 2